MWSNRRTALILIFTTRWPLTGTGWTWKAMGRAGNQRLRWRIQTGSHMATGGIGFTRTAGGAGCLIIRGAGRRFIMAAGSVTDDSAGAGRRTRFGDRRG